MSANPSSSLAVALTSLYFAPLVHGASPDSVNLEKRLSDANAYLSRAVTTGCNSQTLDDLVEVAIECSVADWDGYGAQPANEIALKRAAQFIKSLPANFPAPEPGAMPDGEISLDWDFGPRQTLTVSIGDQPRLAYAAIAGDDEWSGTASFLDRIPKSILTAIEAIIDQS